MLANNACNAATAILRLGRVLMCRPRRYRNEFSAPGTARSDALADTWSLPFGRERSAAVAYEPPAGTRIFSNPFGFGLSALRDGSKKHPVALAIAILVCLRLVLAAVLPLSFDEAYYWLWSKHLAPGYLEHPAAIAFAIRIGTLLFGDTVFGVRAVSLLASVVASWAVWRSAAIILSDRSAAAIACLFFNAPLMVAAEGMGATPDALLVAAAALLLWTIAELERTQDGRWWLAVGAAGGAAIASKYTGIFLWASVGMWLLISASCQRTRPGTVWLRTVWPAIGAAVALAFFAPTLYWNSVHGFISFRFQGSRVLVGRPGVRYLFEFLGSQLALGSPGIVALGIMSSYRILRFGNPNRSVYLVCLVLWVPLIFFTLHALQDRVQGNWPCFVYPALAILAADSFRNLSASGDSSRTARLVQMSAIPFAGIILAVSYAQAFFGLLPMGLSDPVARMTGVGFEPVAAEIAGYAARNHVRAIITTNYATTAWLRFYERPRLPIIQISDGIRFLSSPRATMGALDGNLLYVTERSREALPAVLAHFSIAEFSGSVVRTRNGHPIDAFALFTVSGLYGPPPGRAP